MEVDKSFFEKDAFSAHCGVELLDIQPGKAAAQMTIQPHHLNGVGIVHGAAVFALADAVFAAASTSHDHVAVAININISYLKAGKEGQVPTAVAAENNQRGRMGSYTIRVTDESDDLIAVFEGLVYRKFEKK